MVVLTNIIYFFKMTTLENADTEESISAILSLLGMGMKTVPKNVLRLQFGQASQIFVQILMKYASQENFLILRHVRLENILFFLLYNGSCILIFNYFSVYRMPFNFIKNSRNCCME